MQLRKVTESISNLHYNADNNFFSDLLMESIHVSHQRFFHREDRKITDFNANNVGFFTKYKDFNDFALQCFGVVAKLVIYPVAIVIYALVILVNLSCLLLPSDMSANNKLFNIYRGIRGIIHSALSLVTEPAFTAVAIFTRFFGSLVNPESTTEAESLAVSMKKVDGKSLSDDAMDANFDPSLSI